jgi:F-type H+-transporting ATPase subunit delta
MPNQTLARRYATAVFQLAQESNSIARVQSDLHAFTATLAADASVRKFYISPVVDRKEKSAIIAQAFAALDPIALHTMLLLITKRRESMAEEIVEQFDVLEQRGRNAMTLSVTSARELSKPELDDLVARLASSHNMSYDVTQAVDPSLIGGVRITMGDKRVDGTVAGRLDDIARLLSTN